MCAFNAKLYIGKAIESILNQTYRGFELIIVNDHSTDETQEIIEHYHALDDRIVSISNKEKIGPFRSANRGIREANGVYIARMDADDISLPERFEKQISFLERFPDIGLLGTCGLVIDQKDYVLFPYNNPKDDLNIRWGMLFNNLFLHSSIMFRRSLLEASGGYCEKYYSSQDYEFCSRLMNFCMAANLEENLVYFRKSPDSISSKNKKEQNELSKQISMDNVNRLFGYSFINDPVEVDGFRNLYRGAFSPFDETSVSKFILIADKFLMAQERTGQSEREKLVRLVYKRIFNAVFRHGVRKNTYKYFFPVLKKAPFAFLAPMLEILNKVLSLPKKNSLRKLL